MSTQLKLHLGDDELKPAQSAIPMPDFPTDWKAIERRIDAIDPVRYGRTRNYTHGAVSYLSPYISRGVISTRYVLQQLHSKGYRLPQMEKWVSELAWRDYFQRVWQAKGDAIFEDIKQPQPNYNNYDMPKALVAGNTGIQAIDEAIQVLYNHGYMHNHLRMYTAAITCNIGLSHWRTPAAWMYYHLLDGDIASNTLSWQWVAGSFSHKKYFCNQENINRYTGTDQQGTFLDAAYDSLINMPVPEVLQETTVPTLSTRLPTNMLPVFDKSRDLLLYNAYNLDPNWHVGEEVNRVLLLEPSHFQKFPVSARVLDFILALGKNIRNLQVYTGELDALITGFKNNGDWQEPHSIISKEHPAFAYYPGIKESRDWLVPEVSGYYPGFFAYWKKNEKQIRREFG